MSTATDQAPAETIGELLARLEGIDPRRILLRPAPGTATEADLLRILNHGNRLCELVDSTLVEKSMGAREASLAMWIGHLLYQFVAANNLGELFGADGPFRLGDDLVRLPDVTFIRRENLPNGQAPTAPIPGIAPDLAIEVLSESNTPAEMRRKRQDYFQANTTLVWQVDPERRIVEVFTAPEVSQTFTEVDTLEGGSVLPGLRLPVQRIFERLAPASPSPKPIPRSRSRKKPKE